MITSPDPYSAFGRGHAKHRRHAGLIDRETFDAGYRLVVAGPPTPS